MDILSLLEAGQIAKCTASNLRLAIKRGDLKAQKAGPRAWIVTRIDLDAWINDASLHKTVKKAK